MAVRRPSSAQVGNMIGVGELARRLGLKRETIVTIRKRDRRPNRQSPLPAPLLEEPLLYWWPDVQRWAKTTGRDTT